MDKDTFLKKLHDNSGWDDLTKKGKGKIIVNYKNVEFIIFRDDSSDFLTNTPKNPEQVEIIKEFDLLLKSCCPLIKEEFEEWNQIRLTRDDNECDPI